MKVTQVLTRFYTCEMDQAIAFYEKLLHEPCQMRFKYDQVNLELARVADILILSGSDEALRLFRETQATFLVDSVPEFREFLLANGATVIRDLTEVPTGVNMTVKHSDGMVVEYVEFRK